MPAVQALASRCTPRAGRAVSPGGRGTRGCRARARFEDELEPLGAFLHVVDVDMRLVVDGDHSIAESEARAAGELPGVSG
jgi:hypothetical protein